jgi:predicted ATP-dependent Lon-type protease
LESLYALPEFQHSFFSASVKDIPTIPGELFAKVQTGFYADASDAVFKALGVG